MKVLIINCGSSSLKYELFNLENEKSLLNGAISRIGLHGSKHKFECCGDKLEEDTSAPDHNSAIKTALDTLVENTNVPIKNLNEIGAVAHRVVHGGHKYMGPIIIDDDVKIEIKKLIPLLPLHHPPAISGIEACEKLIPHVPHVAVFDTSFHSTIPDEAAIYGLPYNFFYDKKIKKYGFHGNSHSFVANAAAEYLEIPLKKLNIITCHLGNGASICAIERGKSIDTSMGYGPLQGLIMGTRVGDLDPGIIPYLIRNENKSIDEIDDMMNNKSGLLGISEVSSDMRDILVAANENNSKALLAIKAFCYRIKTYIGAYIAAMGGVDVIVFTGGIGENSRGIRARSVQHLEKIGIAIDLNKNQRCKLSDNSPVYDLTARYSNTTVLAVKTNEELMMARECAQAINFKKSIKKDIFSVDKRPIRVAISAHHVHLCRSDVESLFGPGYKLTEKSPLYIESQFASNEKVNLIGPRGRVDNVRVLGPERDKTQVEISRTEEFQLGIDAPIRASGDLDGTPGLTLEGPAGTIEIPEGVICAMRHIHMTPADAENYGVKNGDIVMVKMESERDLIFGDVLVRVKPSYKLEMHIDTDEANAAELPPVSEGYIMMIESREE